MSASITVFIGCLVHCDGCFRHQVHRVAGRQKWQIPAAHFHDDCGDGFFDFAFELFDGLWVYWHDQSDFLVLIEARLDQYPQRSSAFAQLAQASAKLRCDQNIQLRGGIEYVEVACATRSSSYSDRITLRRQRAAYRSSVIGIRLPDRRAGFFKKLMFRLVVTASGVQPIDASTAI